MAEEEPHVKVTLTQVYKEQQEQKSAIQAMNAKLDKFISVNQRLDSHKNDIAQHDNRLDHLEGTRIPKIESQLAAQWVVVGIMVAGMGGLLVKAFTG